MGCLHLRHSRCRLPRHATLLPLLPQRPEVNRDILRIAPSTTNKGNEYANRCGFRQPHRLFFCFATHRLLIQRIGCSFLQNGGITTFNTHRLNVCYMPPMPSGWLGGIRTQSLGFLTDIGITQESARIPKHRIINLVLTLQRQEIKESPLTPKNLPLYNLST